ncbi:MAG: sulfatase, partial [Verrucomicrobiota bacterium]
DVWLQHDWQQRPDPVEALYDLVFDPQESQNLIHEPQMAEVAQDLRDRMQKWMNETNDPLLSGKVPAHSGVVVNDRYGLSSRDETRPASEFGL